MKNRYVSVKCPSCMSTIQMKEKSLKSDVFFCPVCDYGEGENPGTRLIDRLSDNKLPEVARVLVRL